MNAKGYPGRERRRFRRVDLRFPVFIETLSSPPAAVPSTVGGVTVNLSFGGALIGLTETACLRGATPVTLRFIDQSSATPVDTTGVVWRSEGSSDDEVVAIEFDEPLLAYEGAVEIADRLEWLREMGGDDFLREVVDSFRDSVPEGIRRAEDACRVGDLVAVARIARSLKSSAGNIGAVNLYEVARRAERAARECDAATTARFVERLKAYLRAAIADLDAVAGTASPGEKG